ncbi:MAG TPA: O-antigen ligase family protein [Candidatus Dormibacteraeota bacterium]
MKGAATVLMAVALALTPAYTIRSHAGRYPTTLLEVALLLAIAVGLIALRGRLPWRNPYTLPGLLLLAGATIGVFVSPDRTGALGEWRAFFAEPMAAGLVVAGLARGSDSRVRGLLAGLAAASIAVALVNLVHVVPLQLAHRIDVANPPVAIFQNANQEALFLVPLDGLALAFVLFSSRRADQVAAAVVLVITIPAVLLSYSRGGIAALAVAALVVVLLHPRRWLLLAPVAALLAVGVGLLPGIRRRLAVELDPTSPNNTLHSRLGLWQGTVRMLTHHPLFGAGLRGFDTDVAPYYADPFKVAFPHDLVLNFWSETGLAGLAGFIWLSLAAVVSGARGVHSRELSRVLSVGVLAFVAAVWVHGAVDVPYLKNDLAVAFWAILGVHAGTLGE